MKTRILSVFLIVLLLMGSVGISVSAREADLGSLAINRQYSYIREISEYCQVSELRSRVVSAVPDGDYATVDLSDLNIPNTEEIRNFITDYVFYSVPETFFYNAYYINTSERTISNLYLFTDYTLEEIKTMQGEIDKEVADVYGDILSAQGLTDDDLAALLCIRLTENCEYDYSSPGGENSHNMYGAFTSHIAICQGYTAAYSYLLSKVGITSESVLSDDLLHTWNLVYIDSVPYHVDSTWCDGAKYGFYFSSFLISSQSVQTDHTSNDYYCPENDDRFEKFFSNRSPYFLMGNTIYWADHNAQLLYKRENGIDTPIFKGDYYANTWPGTKEATFATDGEYLLFCGDTSIMRLNPATNAVERICVLENEYPYRFINKITCTDDSIICEFETYNDSEIADETVPYDRNAQYEIIDSNLSTTPTEPDETTVPTTVTDPTEPDATTVPTTVTDPTEPDVTTVPTTVTDPTEPDVTTVPTTVTDPTEPDVTTVPTTVTDPTEPDVTTVPTTATNPIGTTAPTQSTKPTVPVTSSLPAESSTPSLPRYILGDANGDDTVNIKDATAIQKHVAELVKLGPGRINVSDVDSDGKITIKDATAIQKYIVGIEIKDPIGSYI